MKALGLAAAIIGLLASGLPRAACAVDLSQTMVDLSSHNDFEKVAALAKANEIELLMLRGSLGVGDLDPTFSKRLRQALDDKLLVGAYHALFPTNTGKLQADYFVKSVAQSCPPGAKVLLAVDWERPKLRSGKLLPPPPPSMATEFIAETRRLTGKTPMLYTEST